MQSPCPAGQRKPLGDTVIFLPRYPEVHIVNVVYVKLLLPIHFAQTKSYFQVHAKKKELPIARELWGDRILISKSFWLEVEIKRIGVLEKGIVFRLPLKDAVPTCRDSKTLVHGVLISPS